MQYSIVNCKMVRENQILRIEAEFYCSDILVKDNFVLGNEAINFVQYGTSKELNEEKSGYPTLRLNEFDSFFIEEPAKYCDKIDEKTFEKLQLKKGDVLICRTNGNPELVGKSAVVMEDYPYAYASYLFKVRPKKSIINSATLVVYLNSKKGRQEIEKYSMTSNQTNFSPAKFREISIPVFEHSFLIILDKIIEKSFFLLENSKSFYSQTEQLLLSELGLLGWKPKHELVFVKNFLDTKELNRFDAEFFQPKYEEIVEAIKKYKPAHRNIGEGGGGFDELGNLVKIKKSVEPGSEAYQENGVPFVRVSNLSKFELSTNNQQFISEELYEELKTHQPKKGEILLSKDATPGMAYYLNEEPQKMIVSSGILRLKMDNKQILPEYLTLVLNSVIVQKQIERDAGGSIINHWRPDQVKATLIPVLTEDQQKEIKELIEKSFNDRKLSKSLLEIAKRGVEMAIEKNEHEAQEWIGREIQKLGVKI